MLSPRMSLLLVVLLLASVRPSVSAPRPDAEPSGPAAGLTIAVADFNGADKELGRFISETLLTDLAQSEKLHLVERTEIRQALTELKLQSTGLVEPQQVKRLGKLVSANRLIVGSYLVRDDQIIINARLLDVGTGRLAAGGAANASGPRQDLLALSHRLARLFHRRVTGEDLSLDGDTPADPPAPSEPLPSKNRTVITTAPEIGNDDLADLRRKGFIPANARPNSTVTEREFSAVVSRVIRQIALQTPDPVSVMQPNAPVSRLRALAGMIKLLVAPELIAAYRAEPPDAFPPDAILLPTWGRPYVAAAMEQGWWSADRPLHPRENATWTFVAALLNHFSLSEDHAPPLRQVVAHHESEPDLDAYTGLIVDATELHPERAMGPRILDEDGRVVYPDPRYLPDYDTLLDHGLAAYCEGREDSKRAGARPLIVRAIDVTGNVHGDLVVTNRTAERIRAANRRGQFLKRWAVCILAGN